ncbi:MAG: hypothetical protein CMM05_07060 [Rhodopirellula sp.]|nr:hypothetical protein [Rhodopirellula sp.]
MGGKDVVTRFSTQATSPDATHYSRIDENSAVATACLDFGISDAGKNTEHAFVRYRRYICYITGN